MLDKLISEHRHRHHLRSDFVHGRVKQRESTLFTDTLSSFCDICPYDYLFFPSSRAMDLRISFINVLSSVWMVCNAETMLALS